MAYRTLRDVGAYVPSLSTSSPRTDTLVWTPMLSGILPARNCEALSEVGRISGASASNLECGTPIVDQTEETNAAARCQPTHFTTNGVPFHQYEF